MVVPFGARKSGCFFNLRWTKTELLLQEVELKDDDANKSKRDGNHNQHQDFTRSAMKNPFKRTVFALQKGAIKFIEKLLLDPMFLTLFRKLQEGPRGLCF